MAFEHRIDCLGATVLVRCHDPAIAAVVAPLIAEHPPAAEAAHVIDVWTGTTGSSSHGTARRMGVGADLWTGVSLLDGALTLLAMDAESKHVRVHAGAVAREGRAVVVAGATNQGKTSTVVELTTRWRGLRHRRDRRARRAAADRDRPRPSGGAGRAGPGAPPGAATGLVGRPLVVPEVAGRPRAASGRRLPVAGWPAIAVLAHDPGHPTVTTLLDPVEALARLCPLVFNRDALAAQLVELGELLAEVPVVLVRHGGAQDAAQAIADWGVL